MAHSLAKILLHIIFSTKNRHAWINDSIKPRLHAYLAGTCRNLGSHAYRVGGTENHVHIACTLPRTLPVCLLVEQIKTSSSAWVKKEDPTCANFAWQAGYGVFSLGQSQLAAIIKYIDRQHEHHQKVSFKQEVAELVEKYGIETDARYLLD